MDLCKREFPLMHGLGALAKSASGHTNEEEIDEKKAKVMGYRNNPGLLLSRGKFLAPDA
jgi:hypothetical protein